MQNNNNEKQRRCACGCGAEVTRTFLPGHDSVLIARLTRDYESGSITKAQARRAVRPISQALLGKLDRALQSTARIG